MSFWNKDENSPHFEVFPLSASDQDSLRTEIHNMYQARWGMWILLVGVVVGAFFLLRMFLPITWAGAWKISLGIYVGLGVLSWIWLSWDIRRLKEDLRSGLKNKLQTVACLDDDVSTDTQMKKKSTKYVTLKYPYTATQRKSFYLRTRNEELDLKEKLELEYLEKSGFILSLRNISFINRSEDTIE
ncbi:hypothetical protein QNI19_15210 [Cytophagaceae bacterium DM2B3-1]|uniref:Uncharacterized protein n=1 Tax=Xanthocytophaga flava TaxID=3048013 RepID=A0ABT7CKM3_9BACT|nr:hypothetical protein [Xanthocytophaga flavus]MDJ1469779.1 hypothetical protein [Xanthocytophaga flavus]MDJ1494291.1 hypothetical protein [Xanthocytophaga flavus]